MKQDEEKNRAFGICSEHGNPKELICLSGCNVRVCAHCALFGAHRGHDVKEETEVLQLIGEHTYQLAQMLDEMKSAQAELREPKYYWKFANDYRQKKELIKEHIQDEFRAWRKALRALEMKILDELHSSHFQSFEEKFQSAKSENSKMLANVTNLVHETDAIINDFQTRQANDKHYIDFKLTNMETIDLILTKAEAQLDSILTWRDFKSLEGLDKQYSKIQVIFDPAFEAVAEKLTTIVGWEKRVGKIENKIISNKADLSGDINTGQLSFNQESDSQGRSLEAIPAPDISRISFEYE